MYINSCELLSCHSSWPWWCEVLAKIRKGFRLGPRSLRSPVLLTLMVVIILPGLLKVEFLTIVLFSLDFLDQLRLRDHGTRLRHCIWVCPLRWQYQHSVVICLDGPAAPGVLEDCPPYPRPCGVWPSPRPLPFPRRMKLTEVLLGVRVSSAIVCLAGPLRCSAYVTASSLAWNKVVGFFSFIITCNSGSNPLRNITHPR